MIKTEITKSQAQDHYGTIICAGYCQLQSLLKYQEPVNYNAGTFGWNWDLYDIDGVAIVTGYRNLPAGIKNYNLNSVYEAKAKNIRDNDLSYEKKAEAANKLLKEFIQVTRKREGE